MTRHAAGAALAAFVLVGLLPSSALAAGPGATAMRIAVPASARLGEAAQVQARLTDAEGTPIGGATLRFTAQLTFLQASGEVVLGDGTTDKGGIAAVEIELRTEGPLGITAVFEGDAQHAGSSASGTIDVEGGGQLYAQTAGVRLPGLNASPLGAPGSTSAVLFDRVAPLWPAMSGWPIALALMIVWSLYASVVVTLFRIAGVARRADP